MADHVYRDLHVLQRPSELLRDFLKLLGLEQPHVIGDNLPGYAAFAVPALDLEQQALAHIPGRNTGRVQRLNELQGRFNFFDRVLFGLGDFFDRDRKISVVIKIADDCHRRVADFFRTGLPSRADAEDVRRA